MWGPVADIFAPTDPVEEYELGAAFAKLGYKISDVKAIVMGHLHLDHAGGLTNWIGTNVPIWCHKLELESAFYSVATGADDAVYLGHYLDLSLNWKTFDERTTDLFPGITIHHVPGHTAGLCAMQVSLSSGQTYVFLSDHAHVLDNYHGQPQGWLGTLIPRISRRCEIANTSCLSVAQPATTRPGSAPICACSGWSRLRRLQ